MLRFSKILTALAALAGSPAFADETCLAEVRALWADGAAFDAYQRPAHRSTNTVHDAAGNVTRVFTSLIETPLRTVSGILDQHMTLAIDNDVWTGPGLAGPWTKQPQGFTHDRRAGHATDRAQRAANLEDVACLGTVDKDGMSLAAYSFTTRTDPNDHMGGSWFGSANMVYISPETGQVMIWEMSDFVSSWAPEPNGERHVIVFNYDPSVKVMRPE